MRRFFIFYILLQCAGIAHSQDSFRKKFSQSVCACFDNRIHIGGFSDDNFMECVASAMEKDSAELARQCFILYGDSSDETAYKFGRDLFDSVKVDLIYDCENYFVFMDSARNSGFSQFNTDSLKNELSAFQKLKESDFTEEKYFQRGLLNFQLKNFDKAFVDFNRTITLNPANYQCYFFRSWLYEIKKDYVNAIKDLDIVLKNIDNDNIRMIRAIVVRKQSSRNN